jgi:hypothetical protein
MRSNPANDQRYPGDDIVGLPDGGELKAHHSTCNQHPDDCADKEPKKQVQRPEDPIRREAFFPDIFRRMLWIAIVHD